MTRRMIENPVGNCLGTRRPKIHEEGILDRLCQRIIAGEGVKAICRDEAMPSEGAVYHAMASDDAIRSRIARAREAQQDAQAELILEMADSATPEDWQVVKLRIWTRQWVMARLAPKKYGARIMQDHSVSVTVSHEEALAALEDDR